MPTTAEERVLALMPEEYRSDVTDPLTDVEQLETDENWKTACAVVMQLLNVEAVVATYDGGNDSGSLNAFRLAKTGEDDYYDGQSYVEKYRVVTGPSGRPQHVRALLNHEDRGMELLRNLIWEPISARYGNFAGEYSCSGTIYLCRTGEAKNGRGVVSLIFDNYTDDYEDEDEDEDEGDATEAEVAQAEVPFGPSDVPFF